VDVSEGQTRIGGGIAITRALGDHFAKDNDSGMIAVPYISEPIKLTPNDTHLILASDGVRWTCLQSESVLHLVINKQLTHTTLIMRMTVVGRDIGEESARPGAYATGSRRGAAPAEGGAAQQRM
jgi:serine/threonine protein phosphatase PrpC